MCNLTFKIKLYCLDQGSGNRGKLPPNGVKMKISGVMKAQ
jgi:hypothetical protein